jgi:hypothetical protein
MSRLSKASDSSPVIEPKCVLALQVSFVTETARAVMRAKLRPCSLSAFDQRLTGDLKS